METPVPDIPESWQLGLCGGLLIGLASAAFILLQGRIAGVTGIVATAMLERPPGQTAWRWTFVAGLALAGAVLHFFPLQQGAGPLHQVTSLPQLVVAGLLVGFGTRLANGCTSGHGVCGLARLSPRSVLATVTFMGAGFVVAFVLRQVGMLLSQSPGAGGL